MKKNIWIFNHYAAGMYKNYAGRHYWFAENLIKQGHKVTIFCASSVHNSNENIDTGSQKFKSTEVNGISFVFIKTPSYIGNGINRIKNIFTFYLRLFPISKEYAKKHEKPDIILASSVHPLTLVAGIKIAKKFDVPCICEIRDLWPEALIDHGILKEDSIIARLLYQGEKWIYRKADKLIFTMEGGKNYIIDKGWHTDAGGPIDLTKVNHINNGVNLDDFNYNRENYFFDDIDLNNSETFKVMYTGSIRKANNVKKIVGIAEIINKKGYENIVFLIFGEGTEKESLEKYCQEHQISNIKFKGKIDKKNIPFVLSQSNLNIIQLSEQNNFNIYGASINKMFEYFASGKPILSDSEDRYDLIKKYECGIVLDNADKDQLAEAIIKFYQMEKDVYQIYHKNALKAAKDYDFKVLTKKLEQLL